MGRADFEDEAVTSLRNLGYSEEEIGATAGQLPAHLGTEERLRQSLRALNDVHTEKVQGPYERERLAKSEAEETDRAYNEGRRDESRERVQKQRQLRAQRPPREKSAAAQRRDLMGSAMKLGRLARMAQGKRR